jgi:hypothetical protein
MQITREVLEQERASLHGQLAEASIAVERVKAALGLCEHLLKKVEGPPKDPDPNGA